MKNYIGQAGTFIQDNKKPLLYIGGAVAIVVIGYAVVSRLKGGIQGIFKDKSLGATDFKPLELDNTKVTISDTLANTYANQLWGAMNTTGTDEDLIYAILLKLQKKDDFLKVYNAFGKKSYNGILLGGEPNVVDKWLGNYDDLDLVQWLNTEIGYSNLTTYNLLKKTVTNAGLAL
jgi:hypothetical protein